MVRARFSSAALALVIVLGVWACSSKAPTGPSESGDPVGPTITAHPQSQTVAPGSTATLSVGAASPTAILYQWFLGAAGDTAAPVPGATSASFTTPAITSSTQYWVRVSSSGRNADSTAATVNVSTSVPSIVEQPENETVTSGRSARLSVEVAGTGPFTYQWYRRDGESTSQPIEGATAAEYTTPPLTVTTRYWVRVTNATGSVDSVTVTVVVASAPDPNPPAPPAPNPPAPPPPAPPAPAPDPGATAFEDDVLLLVNQRRAAGAVCGGTTYGPAPALVMNGSLRTAARAHSQDMAAQNYFSHTSLDGRSFSQRMSDAGYSGSPRGENIAAGYGSPSAVVAGWMGSTGHCENIMNPAYRSAGVGYAFGAASQYGSYWTMNFGGN